MIMKYLIFACLLISSYAISVEEAIADKKPSGLTTYDQRQTGKYNLHVNIKDVQFFSLSDSLASIGDYSDYGDYGDLEGGFGETDYDTSHLTVNPVFAFLGSNKPTTQKPSTTSQKAPPSSSSTTSTTTGSLSESTSSTIKESSNEKPSDSIVTTVNKQETDSGMKNSTIYMVKPALVDDKNPPLEAIDYEEIPVEVQYYRANHQKLPLDGRQAAINRFHKRQPSVQIIDGHGRASNVKIMETEHPTVKICGRGEIRDNHGRCRVRSRRGAPGL